MFFSLSLLQPPRDNSRNLTRFFVPLCPCDSVICFVCLKAFKKKKSLQKRSHCAVFFFFNIVLEGFSVVPATSSINFRTGMEISCCQWPKCFPAQREAALIPVLSMCFLRSHGADNKNKKTPPAAAADRGSGGKSDERGINRPDGDISCVH